MRSTRPSSISTGTSRPYASASATASGEWTSSMFPMTRIFATSTLSSPGVPRTASSFPTGVSSGSSGQRVIVTIAASPSLPLFPSGPVRSRSSGSGMGPRTRVSSGSSHALRPRRRKTPATRFTARLTTRTISPSTPRFPRARTCTTTLSPCIAPFIPSLETYTSSPVAPMLATKPKPRAFTVSVPSRSSASEPRPRRGEPSAAPSCGAPRRAEAPPPPFPCGEGALLSLYLWPGRTVTCPSKTMLSSRFTSAW